MKAATLDLTDPQTGRAAGDVIPAKSQKALGSTQTAFLGFHHGIAWNVKFNFQMGYRDMTTMRAGFK